MRFLLETEGNIKRPTLPEHSRTSSAKKSASLVKNEEDASDSSIKTTTNLVKNEEDKSGSSDISASNVGTKPKIE